MARKKALPFVRLWGLSIRKAQLLCSGNGLFFRCEQGTKACRLSSGRDCILCRHDRGEISGFYCTDEANFQYGAQKGKIQKISKDMKQKIGLIAVFMREPEVLALDVNCSTRLGSIYSVLSKKEGTTILMSPHLLEEIEKTCDTTAMIRHGKMIDTVQISTLSKINGKIYKITFPNAENIKS